jgi:hypothetical protein
MASTDQANYSIFRVSFLWLDVHARNEPKQGAISLRRLPPREDSEPEQIGSHDCRHFSANPSKS